MTYTCSFYITGFSNMLELFKENPEIVAELKSGQLVRFLRRRGIWTGEFGQKFITNLHKRVDSTWIGGANDDYIRGRSSGYR